MPLAGLPNNGLRKNLYPKNRKPSQTSKNQKKLPKKCSSGKMLIATDGIWILLLGG